MTLLQTKTNPTTALYFAPVALAIGIQIKFDYFIVLINRILLWHKLIHTIYVYTGSSDGLHSLRGSVRVEWEDSSPPRGVHSVEHLSVANTRVLMVSGGRLVHAGRLALGSALRRAGSLQPSVVFARVQLNDNTPPHLVKVG